MLVWSGRLLLVGYFSAALLILIGRYGVLPEISRYQPRIEQELSAAIGLPVKIARLSAEWPGLHPQLAIDGLEIRDQTGRPALAFDHVEAEIGWSSLWHGTVHLRRIEFVSPSLDIRRDASGALFVAGLPVSSGGDSGLADWLLAQGRIVVRDARIVWHDDWRAAPPLELAGLNFDLRNAGRHHSFGLAATPAPAVATSFDVRGNLTGLSPDDLAGWRGELYAAFAGVDLAAWSPWLDLPLEMTRGKGGARLWLNFANLQPTGVVADLKLEEVALRLQPGRPPLALQRIEGRVAGRRIEGGFAGEIRHLSLATDNGVELPATDVELTLTPAGRRAGGLFRANGLDLAVLAALADDVPLPAEWRQPLKAYAPQGRLEDLELAWQGSPEAPTGWQVKGGFAGLGLAAHKELPGFGGLSGRIDGDARAGRVTISTRDAHVDLPAVFADPRLPLAMLDAELGWKAEGAAIEFRLPRLAFANADAHGEANGSYRFTGTGPGEIDLTARLTDAAGDAVWRYMPLVVNKTTRDWLRASIIGGRADSTTLRLKGPLAEFPFRDGKQGIFQVKGSFRGATLDYAAGWPVIRDIDGELLFEGARMLIRGQRAQLAGAALVDVRAEIADLEQSEEILAITGRARGETQRFLDFIEASPVGKRIDHFTETMTASGNGELDLKLTMPLRHVDTTQVQGRYRFADNRLQVMPTLPPFTQAQGEFSFSADRLQAKNLRARMLNYPLTLEVGSAPGGTVRVGVAGTLEARALREFYGLRALDHLSGETPWRGNVVIKRPSAEIRLESNLEGLASSLPEPFNKQGRVSLPLRVTGRIGPQPDVWTVTLGDAVAAHLVEAGDSWRGRIALGAAAGGVPPAPSLPAQGVALAINLPAVDADLWRDLLPPRNGNGSSSNLPPLTAIDLRSADLHLMRRHFHDFRLQGTRADHRWRFALDSREAQGALTWDAGGAGRIAGRLARLHLPAAEPAATEPESAGDNTEMPAVDLTVDNLRIGALALGEAKAQAENRDGVWQARLDIANEAARLTGEGRWRPGRNAPETALNFKLEVGNAEKLLDRLGMPDAVRRGDGRIEGDLRWAGAPTAFDLASLSGRLKADIGKGQFKKLEPGVGRLLGVLSLQSLPRRITLDFRDIFSEGFAFDSIAGEAAIKQGVMTTDELRIRGPAAKVLLAGEANLVAETQHLKVRVQPALGETIAVGAMIANPVAGAVAWAAQKVLNDPLDQIFAYEYAVTGSWSDPQVEKVSRKFSEPAPGAP